jgi:hypothetical protein
MTVFLSNFKSFDENSVVVTGHVWLGKADKNP